MHVYVVLSKLLVIMKSRLAGDGSIIIISVGWCLAMGLSNNRRSPFLLRTATPFVMVHDEDKLEEERTWRSKPGGWRSESYIFKGLT